MAITKNDLKNQLITLRRSLHQNPEIGFNTFNTAKFIYDFLKSLGYQVFYVCNKAGVIGKLTLNKSKTIAFRADIDALNIKELNDIDYKSKNEYMHACGHDAHTAILLTSAILFKDNKDNLETNINLIFQPAEEGPLPGGALSVIDSHLLDDTNLFFAFHVTNKLLSGTIGIKNHEACSAPDLWEGEITGIGCHAATPSLGINPIPITSNIILSFNNLYQEILKKDENVVISTTYVSSGNSMNIIPQKSYIKGTARSFSMEMRNYLKDEMTNIFTNTLEKYQAKGEFKFHFAYDPVYNDDEPVSVLRKSAMKVLEEKDILTLSKPEMFGDDFSYYRRIAPTCYALLGVRGIDQEYIDLHSPYFCLDEENLINICYIYLEIVKSSS